jgi:uncharacterized protein YndB with AHSA1/START domain
MAVPSDAVWAALADGWTYSRWVVGTSAIRGVDATFPAVGSALHYRVGRGPLAHEGHTEVRDVAEGKRLELEAHGWPFGTVRIELHVAADGDGTLVTLDEHPMRGIAATLHNPLADLLLRKRNELTLRRLERVAQERAAAAG